MTCIKMLLQKILASLLYAQYSSPLGVYVVSNHSLVLLLQHGGGP